MNKEPNVLHPMNRNKNILHKSKHVSNKLNKKSVNSNRTIKWFHGTGKKKNYWLTLFLFKKFTINKINKKLSANCVESRARFQHTKRQGKVKNF